MDKYKENLSKYLQYLEKNIYRRGTKLRGVSKFKKSKNTPLNQFPPLNLETWFNSRKNTPLNLVTSNFNYFIIIIKNFMKK